MIYLDYNRIEMRWNMPKKKKKRYTAKTRGRIMVIFVFFSAVVATLGYTLLFNLKHINDLENEKKELKKEKISLKDEESAILADIKRLSDPLYVSRYAREKYFYSKEGELILRLK